MQSRQVATPGGKKRRVRVLLSILGPLFAIQPNTLTGTKPYTYLHPSLKTNRGPDRRDKVHHPVRILVASPLGNGGYREIDIWRMLGGL